MLRAAREAAGVGLREIARRTHYSPAYLSDIERGKRPAPADVVAAYETALGSNLDRLTSLTKTPASVDTAALSDVAVMLSATRRIEDATGPLAVLPAVAGMATMAETFADQARSCAARKAAGMASEIDQYRGWLEHATGADKASGRSLRKAVDLAQVSGDPDRLVHGLSFTAYVDLERGERTEAAALSDAALAVQGAHPLIRVYEHFQRARIHAVEGEPAEAQRRLCLADRAMEAADGHEPPEAGYWYTPGFFGLQRSRVLRMLGQDDRARQEVRAAVDALPEEHRRAEWAAKWRRAADGETDIPH
ncbi:helix-turn-helix domain-containing protein [Nocardia cyriacigeorgica]|uniref:helix-turn-helix domain-containing protein n=1 Tax=Nocardia cyriacigeorgica TaxID=135487 RepID=UPI00138AE537|nr:helix-turn-helix transcriptional regulator [Nocardia cyriacigeorgica]